MLRQCREDLVLAIKQSKKSQDISTLGIVKKKKWQIMDLFYLLLTLNGGYSHHLEVDLDSNR